MKKICLNMIVKNESKIIERMLESVIGLIDYFVICDTGSADNTIEIIKNFFIKNNNIKGLIIKKNFKDFEYNRNYSLKFCEGFGDYILLLDADHILNINSELDIEDFKNKLDKDSYSILQEDNNFSYQNIRLIKNHYKFYYKGYTHEVIRNEKNFFIEILDKNIISIKDVGDGSNKKDKLERDLILLKKSVKEFPDDIRNIFYLANTYFSLELFDLAKKIYKIRSEKGGWKQEVYYCYYRIGLVEIINKEYDKAIKNFWEAYDTCPERCENLYYLYKLYKCLRKDNLTKLVLKLIKENKNVSKENFLFFDKKINDSLDDIFNINI